MGERLYTIEIGKQGYSFKRLNGKDAGETIEPQDLPDYNPHMPAWFNRYLQKWLDRFFEFSL